MDDVCICAEWDGRGFSTCGVTCSAHPPDGLCPDCGDRKTHKSVVCIGCAPCEFCGGRGNLDCWNCKNMKPKAVRPSLER